MEKAIEEKINMLKLKGFNDVDICERLDDLIEIDPSKIKSREYAYNTIKKAIYSSKKNKGPHVLNFVLWSDDYFALQARMRFEEKIIDFIDSKQENERFKISFKDETAREFGGHDAAKKLFIETIQRINRLDLLPGVVIYLHNHLDPMKSGTHPTEYHIKRNDIEADTYVRQRNINFS